MIDFEPSQSATAQRQAVHALAQSAMRPIAREYDEREHERPWDFIRVMWELARQMDAERGRRGEEAGLRRERTLSLVMTAEELAWGDAGLFICAPGPGLGGVAITAAGTPEQQKRFLGRFREGEPKWGAMAITEAHCGSDTAAIRTTAARDGDDWVLNGTKIFCTGGQMAAEHPGGFVVVWATVDKSAGRAGIKPFIVEAGTPGMKVLKVEDKLGIRASDTATLVFEDCRVPLSNILGDPEVTLEPAGFKGVMATFDASRPLVAAMAIGVGRAALDYLRDLLKEKGIPIRYGVAPTRLTALERDFMDMEADLHAARLLAWRAAWMIDQGLRNNLEASMAKAKAGLAAARITQKVVELLGPLGYSRDHPAEKWMRDAKINDIFEGTQQINMLIVARRILDYSSRELS